MSASFSRWQYSTKKFLRARSFWHLLTFAALTFLLVHWLRSKPSDSAPKQRYEPVVPVAPSAEEPKDGIDWTRFAYCQYVTDIEYLCNSLMIFESLHRLGSKADRLMLYPHYWELYPKVPTWQSKFLHKAQKEYKVHIVPVRVQHFDDGEVTWADSFTKLLAFKQTQYERVLSIDSDATVLQVGLLQPLTLPTLLISHVKPLDELFLLPHTAVAAPHAYWMGNDTLSSAILLIEPSQAEYKRVLNGMRNRTNDDFDMEIINDLYGGDAVLLPNDHWIVSGEFRRKDHSGWLTEGKEWNATRVLNETKFVHFSDWPYPKPWFPASEELVKSTTPACVTMPGSDHKDCSDRDAWKWLYADFERRRKSVCGHVFTLY